MNLMDRGLHYDVRHIVKNKWMLASIAALGSAICIGTLAFFDQSEGADYLLIAPFGATMVLVFGLPASPLAQPKNVILGHICTALVGIVFVNYIEVTYWSLGLAVGCGIFLMIVLGITHPPAGGNPLLIMVGGHTSWLFAVYPVAAGAVSIVIIALVYHTIASRIEFALMNKETKDV